jgi:four helix bundle protein
MQRAAISVMSNIAEGFERRKPGEFAQFLGWAQSSCAEVRSQLYIALDAGHLKNDAFTKLMNLAMEVARIIGGLRAYVETCKPKAPSRARQPKLGTGNRELGTS